MEAIYASLSGDSPVSMVTMHVWFTGLTGHFRRICRQKYRKTSFSPIFVFLFGQNSRVRFWELILWYLWIGRARHPGPPSHSHHVGVEVLNVGGWLTHGDLALEAGVDFSAVAEHRLTPSPG